MARPCFTAKQWIMIATPPVLIVTMFLAFQGLTRLWGQSLGYFAAYMIYFVGWCIALPLVILTPKGLLRLYREAKPRFGNRPYLMALIVFWPILLPLGYRFLPNISHISLTILALSIGLGVVTGVTEEILWRGVYTALFPKNWTLGYIYPAVGFGLWHIAPQSVLSSTPGGPIAFVTVALLLGLSWGYYAQKTGSIRWCTVAHIINDSLGLAGSSWLTILTSL